MRKKKKNKPRNIYAESLGKPQYRMRVVRSKKAYNRKRLKNKVDNLCGSE